MYARETRSPRQPHQDSFESGFCLQALCIAWPLLRVDQSSSVLNLAALVPAPVGGLWVSSREEASNVQDLWKDTSSLQCHSCRFLVGQGDPEKRRVAPVGIMELATGTDGT